MGWVDLEEPVTTLDALLKELATVRPVPPGEYAFPCWRCLAQRRSGQPPVAEGLWTAAGLAEHEAVVHGEVRR